MAKLTTKNRGEIARFVKTLDADRSVVVVVMSDGRALRKTVRVLTDGRAASSHWREIPLRLHRGLIVTPETRRELAGRGFVEVPRLVPEDVNNVGYNASFADVT